MSPYKFMSKTHSLSTEDLGKFFIHSFIDLPFNTMGTFYYKNNWQKFLIWTSPCLPPLPTPYAGNCQCTPLGLYPLALSYPIMSLHSFVVLAHRGVYLYRGVQGFFYVCTKCSVKHYLWKIYVLYVTWKTWIILNCMTRYNTIVIVNVGSVCCVQWFEVKWERCCEWNGEDTTVSVITDGEYRYRS